MMFLLRHSNFVVRGSLFLLVFVLGCQEAGKQEKSSPSSQVSTQKPNLQSKLEESQTENEQLKKQVESLSSLPGDKRAEEVYHLQAVKIGRYTNLYDEDKNGTKETLVVYVQPIDETGDAIKAAGQADVQLWDLNKKENEAMLAQWRVEPNEMKKLWLNSLFGGNYRLSFDVNNLSVKSDDQLTVKVAFTDYLSGRTFTDQLVLRPEKTRATENKKAIKPE